MKLIPVHMAWNDENGNLDALTAIEFTEDCEFCALETDPIDGDPITFSGNSFTIFESKEHMSRNEGTTFQFNHIDHAVGNWCWDMIWMTPEECGRFMEHVQSKKHWTITAADPEIFKNWGTLKGSGFVRYAMEEMECQ
jgi:hypothetical protein